MTKLHLLFTVFCILSLIHANPVDPQPDMVVEVFRHGARGPVRDQLNTWGKETGQLTGVGMRMHYLLGAALRDRYPTLLTNYDPAKIILRSTDVNRTIMSAYSQMYGIYAGTGAGLFGDDVATLTVPPYVDYDPNVAKTLTNDAALPFNYQTLPIHVDSALTDKMLTGMGACPNFNAWADELNADEESTKIFNTELVEVTKTLRAANIKISTGKDVSSFGDTAIANKFENVPIPGNIPADSQDYLDIKFAAEWQFFKAYGSGKNEAALHSLYLLRGIQDYINSFLNKTSPANFVFLSAHDSTLMPVLAAFGITTKDCLLANHQAQKAGKAIPNPSCLYPAFASNLIFEVYGKETENAYVKFYYNNVPQPICGKTGEGSNTCTMKELDAYIGKVTNNYSFADYAQKCGVKAAVMPTVLTNTYGTINLGFGVLAAVLAISLILTCSNLKKKEIVLNNDSEANKALLANK